MSLDTYRRKRNFSVTSEPSGKKVGKTKGGGLSFVVQKHAAGRLHYDFRLELDGTLKSWAVPKGPSLDPAEKRLAMHVEDHPIEYADFEGIIPPNQYGAGTVIVWDRGTWTPESDDVHAAYRAGRLKFRLEGEKLRGGWALVRIRSRGGEKRESWLLMKERDAEAHAGEGDKLLERRPESVTSGRTLDEVAQGRRALRPASRRATGRQSGARKPGERKASVPRRARAAAAFPAWIEPELATLVDAAPERGDWRYEVKYDGYRVLVRAHRDQVKIFTRNQQDWTERFPRIAAELARLELEATWLDGEVCALTKDGRSSFSVLQRALSGEAKQQPVLIAFDLPYARGNDLRNEPLSVRQAKLQELLGKPGRRSLLKLSESLSGSGEVIRAKACKLGLEGVIGKRADSAYVGRRTRDWIKLKCRQRQEMIIAGYTSGTGMREALGSLILAVREPGGALRYAGRVGTGFNDAMLRRLVKALAPLRREGPTVEGAPRRVSGHMIHWVRPELVAEVSFAEWTHEGIVRQASFEGLREDKKAADVTRETPQATPSDVSKAVPASSRSIKHATVIAGVKVSHPDRMLFSDLGITKLDIARYYERVAPIMLKYAGGRPLALLRCPDGPDGACFFQKHAVAGRIPGVDMVKIREGGGVHQYVMANRAAALVGLAQMNVLELHLWGSRADDVERPDTLVIDLDPDRGLPWVNVAEAATLTRRLFEELGLKCFLKTTGGKGLHVVLPVTRRHTWDEVKTFARAVAERMVSAMPDRFIATAGKHHRSGKIFIDYLRNARGSLAVAPYSVRARPGATVATPLSWDELEPKLDPAKFNVLTVPERLDKIGDPWDGYARVRQTLTASSKRLRSA